MFTHFSSFSPNTLLVLFFIFFFGYFDGKREEEGDIIDLKSLYCLECFFFLCGQRIRCNLFDMRHQIIQSSPMQGPRLQCDLRLLNLFMGIIYLTT